MAARKLHSSNNFSSPHYKLLDRRFEEFEDVVIEETLELSGSGRHETAAVQLAEARCVFMGALTEELDALVLEEKIEGITKLAR